MDFTRKATWVLDGHKTPYPIRSTFAGVVLHESVRIAFTYAVLNGLQVFAADLRNAYLQAPSSQKDYVVCGPEFGIENIAKVVLINRALCGGKSAGQDFRNHLRSCMHHFGQLVLPSTSRPQSGMLKNTLRSLMTSGGKYPTRLKLLCG